MKKLIIHADDFNLTFGINLGIIKAFKEGIARSTSIMINLPGIEHSISLLRENPKLDIGLHVNLTFGKPILNPREALSLIDQEGFFYRKINLLMQKACALEIEKEIIAQVKKARSLKLNISHLDSHHHLHKEKEVMEIFKKIARKEDLALRANNLKMKSQHLLIY
ncbi:MAG: ChbG/HpnK family deacetylase [Armatimonadetes bacterium]|nr:ChbG/HpnK family deacetylase [Armatimonadota bacterium]